MFTLRKIHTLAALTLACSSTLGAQIIGTNKAVSNSGDISYSDGSYSTNGSEYLLVWHRKLGASDQILGRRMNAAGTFLGANILIATAGSNERGRPTVAYVDGAGRWLVAWQEKSAGKWQVLGRSVRPTNGAQSPTAVLASSSNDQILPDLAGDTSTDNDAILVWESKDAGVRSRQIQISGASKLGVGAVRIVSLDARDQRPRISQSGGSKRRYVTVWQRSFSAFSSDVYARGLDANGTPEGAELGVATGSPQESKPSIDGDGENFYAVWQRRESGLAANYDIYARRLQHDGDKVVLGAAIQSLSAEKNSNEDDVAVAHLGDKICVTWEARTGTNLLPGFRFRMFCKDSLAPCSTIQGTSSSSRSLKRPALVSRWANGSNSDHGVILYTSDDSSFDGDLRALRVEAIGAGGPVTNLGGGCGPGGALSASGALALGNAKFKLSLKGASPSGPFCILNIAAHAPPLLICGPCAITNPTVLLAAPLTNGRSEFRIPVPCRFDLFDADLQFQCFVPASRSTPCAGIDGVSFSNRIRGVIRQ